MVQHADNHGDKQIGKVLCLTNSESSAFASLMYMIAKGEIDTGYLAVNDKEALLQVYADAYWSGIRLDKRREQAEP